MNVHFRLSIVCILRAIFFFGLALGLNQLLDTGASSLLMAGSSVIGVAFATWLASSRITFQGFILILIGIFITHYYLFWGVQTFYPDITSDVFSVYGLEEETFISLLGFSFAALSTWFFCRIPGVATLELIGVLALFIALLSGHRDFHLDSPKLFTSLAWSFGVDPIMIFVVAGLCGALLTTYYSFLTEPMSNATDQEVQQGIFTQARFRRDWPVSIALVVGIAVLFWVISSNLYKSFSAIQLARITNGVGQERSPGISPLGFHSALGSTNQPAALIRLDGDYDENPFSPMLYLRENALSQFNGKELVMADRLYDQDVTNTTPEEAFTADSDPELPGRRKLSISAYLLANHNSAFAIDYPISITPIKNPNAQRFKGAFRAVSLVPSYKLEEMQFDEVGDSRWSKEVWHHYVTANLDPRYQELAKKIAGDAATPVLQAMAIAGYLSENAIYTLTPNHSMVADEDPVAPFLFGDMRGYCVHFAHATVYMLRALGIPARIGTGYLTDLSQAKDGHILLRMSDRHAWAEMYVAKKGWVPIDTKPTKVESHAESQVDMKLLEELMGMLGPDELILPKDVTKDEKGLADEQEHEPISLPNLTPFILCFLFIIYALKAFIRFGWLLPASNKTTVIRAYRAFSSFYQDLGAIRGYGETRLEYKNRLDSMLSMQTLQVTDDFLASRYQPEIAVKLNRDKIRELCHKEYSEIKRLGLGYRFVSFLNPLSLFSSLGGRI